MKYDFTSIINRYGKDALAVDYANEYLWKNEDNIPKEGFDLIPMWVADMNFATSPSITKALQERIAHPLYGYYRPPKEYKDSIMKWQEEHHLTKGLSPEGIGYENGVHGCIMSCIQTFSQPGEAIFLHRPHYIGFIHDVNNLGRKLVCSNLVVDENGTYRMDYEDMEKKLQENHCHLAIFCSPHNPSGRVWERWELEKAMEIFERNQVLVISDEIWADITYPGHQHIPTQMVNEWSKQNTIAIYAPSKTFNLAGLIGSYHIVYNKELRDKLVHFSENTQYNEQNVLSMHALLGAYSEEGAQWVEELKMVLEHNTTYMSDFLNGIDGIKATKPEGTYMVFADCSEYCKKHNMELEALLKKGWEVGVGWQNGIPFGGDYHIRINVASPTARIEEACKRLQENVF